MLSITWKGDLTIAGKTGPTRAELIDYADVFRYLQQSLHNDQDASLGSTTFDICTPFLLQLLAKARNSRKLWVIDKEGLVVLIEQITHSLPSQRIH